MNYVRRVTKPHKYITTDAEATCEHIMTTFTSFLLFFFFFFVAFFVYVFFSIPAKVTMAFILCYTERALCHKKTIRTLYIICVIRTTKTITMIHSNSRHKVK